MLATMTLSIVLAIVCVLCFEDKENNSVVLCAEFFLNNYSHQQLNGKDFLQYVLLSRFPLLGIGVLNATNFLGDKFFYLVLHVGVFAFSFLTTEFAYYYKIKACVLLAGIITPQWYFYIAAFLLFERARKNKNGEEIKAATCSFLLGFVGFLLGILMEVSLNPIWVKTLMKI